LRLWKLSSLVPLSILARHCGNLALNGEQEIIRNL